MDFFRAKTETQAQTESFSTAAYPAASMAAPSKFGRFINWILMALVAVVPVLFLTWTSEFREFNKQSFLIFGVLLACAVWMIKILVTRRLGWNKNVLDLAVLGYLAVYLVSSILSVDKFSSFLGYAGRYTGSLFSVFALVLLYFIITNNVRSQQSAKRIALSLVVGSGLAIVYSTLQVFGLYVLPSFHDVSFNPIGSLAALSVFAAVSVLFYQWFLYSGEAESPVMRAALIVLSIVGLVLLFMLGALIGWLTLLLGMVVFLGLGTATSNKSNTAWFWQPMVIMVISILFVAFNILPASVNPRNLIKSSLPTEIQLSNGTTLDMIKNSYSNGKSALIGSGPGTTGIVYGEIKPQSLNKTVVWSVVIDRASSEIGNIAIETGILGLIAFEGLAIWFLIYALRFLLKRTDHAGHKYALGFFVVWAALYIAHFLYFFNTTFQVYYWASLAMFMAMSTSSAEQEPAVAEASGSMSWTFASLLVLAVLLIGIFFQSTVYVAEAAYTNGVKTLNQTNPDLTKAALDFRRSVSLNPYNDTYLLAYAHDLIFLASAEAAKDNPNMSDFQNWLAAAVAAGKKAVQISPKKASDWSALGQLYGSLKPLGVSGTEQEAIDSWKQAITHDSKNPILYVRLAQAYVNASASLDLSNIGVGTDTDKDGLSDVVEQKLGSDPNKADTNGDGKTDSEDVKAGLNPAGTGTLTAAQIRALTKTDPTMLTKAEEVLNQAISIKQDLPDSYIALSRVYEQEKKLSDSKKLLDDAAGKFPFNSDIRYEQGRITLNTGDVTTAEAIFNDVLKLSPNNANALFSLGVIYEGRGDKAKALEMYKQVRELTGPNVELDRRINALQNPGK